MKRRASEHYFEEIGESFDRWMSEYDVERRIKLLQKFLPQEARTMSCLEVGCGTGKISEAIKPLVGELTVSDVSRSLAESVGTQLRIDWMESDACKLGIPDNTYDLVVSSECIEHTSAPKTAIREMVRVMAKGGTIIVTSPNRLWYPALWVSQKLGVRNFEGNELWLYPWEAANVLSDNGVEQVMIGGCHLFPWQIPGAKRVLPFFDRFHRQLYPVMINYGICGMKQ